jgi:energy-coupling factor transporter ATP-binding protein EcfA2
VLDAELAGLLWLLLEARLPVLVAGAPGSGRTTLLTALLDLLSPDARTVPLDGAVEDFAWLPEAPELGWRPERHDHGRPDAAATVAVPATPSTTVLLAAELGDLPPSGTWGQRARIAIRALALGYGMAATMAAERLETVLDRLREPPVSASDDELARLGLVLILGAPVDAGDGTLRPRLAVAHYVRPVVRDGHGHVQRLPPAVIAARDARNDSLEHFAWGIVTELAARAGRRPLDFEREHASRAQYLGGLAAAGLVEPDAVRVAIAGYRGTSGGGPPA